jgi:glucan phosphoethanolaminetransferase (alkaline phosphatase superfamily)
MKMRPPDREMTSVSFAGATLVLFSAFFFALRAYETFVSRNPGASSAASPIPGFLEDFGFGAGLGLLTLLALATGKRVYFLTAFPLEIFVVLLSYANLQYVNFYGDNIRLFDLEYVQNMGATWKETIRDVWMRPVELLFLLVPLAVLAAGGIVLRRTRVRGSGKKRILVWSLSLAAAAVFACVAAGPLKQKAESGDFVRNNIWVGFLRDVPRLGAHIRMIREIRATTAGKMKPGFQKGKKGGERPVGVDPPLALAGENPPGVLSIVCLAAVWQTRFSA